MFFRIARFELGYQLKNPVFWVVSILFFLLTFGAVTIDDISIGSGGNIHVNSPGAIMQISLILSLFFMFVTTAFVANIIVRDDESGFGPMVRSTPVRKFDYLFGRFAGAFLVALIAFLAVPLGVFLGSLMPWLDPETVGPNRLEFYAFSYLALAVPALFLTASVFFAVATVTRSMMYSYLAVVVFLVLYLAFISVIGNRPEWQETGSLVEPFGLGVLAMETRYWTAAELNGQVIGFSQRLIANRAIWIGVSLAALAFAYWRFSFAEKGVSKRKLKKQRKQAAKLANVAPRLVESLPAPDVRAAWRAQLWAQCKLEMVQVLRSPAFFILMLFGLFNSGAGMLSGVELYGTPAHPLTFSVIGIIIGTFAIIPLIIAIYYAGELVWRDRDRKMHEIVDATAVPNWAYLLPKMLAVSVVLFATLLVSMVAGMLIQSIRGLADFELGKYIAWYVVPLGVDMVILAVLSVFVQAISPNKYIGWAIMLVYFVASLTFANIGFEHPLYQYGATGPNPLSDMNGDAVGRAGSWWMRLYWAGWALALAVFAHLLWRRGTETSLMPRLRLMGGRLAGMPGVLLGGAALIAGASGTYIFYNTNVLNEYRTSDDGEAQLAEYEKAYLKYEDMPRPTLTHMQIDARLFPAEHRAVFTGRYDMVNRTGQPLDTLHVRFTDPDIEILKLDVPGSRLELDDEDNKYRIYRLDTPMQPGEARSIAFETRRWQRGFRASGNDVRLVGNGTFLNNAEFGPQLGMDRSGLLSDRATRRKYGLPPELRPARLEDMAPRNRNYVGNAEWVTTDITLSTAADQVPVAPGRKLSDTVANGRRTAHFVSQQPILGLFSIQSADYTVRQRKAGGINYAVYYYPGHDFNVERMLKASETSLDYYRRNFGPYQFDYFRIIEFPGYASFAQAFAGTIPYSESIGFIADTSDPDAIDYATYVTAHEAGHQYWAHQMISADMQGGTMLVETLAQYSALMVMKQVYGEDKIRRFLQYELDNYLNARGGEAIEELPLVRVENQGYIHYRKGAVVMYLLQDRLGEDRVNAALRDMLQEYRFKGPPYPRSIELVDRFKALARDDEERQLVADLFDRITLYDFKAESAKVTKRKDGRFVTEITLDATKYYADGKGKESEAPFAGEVDIGLFMARPGLGAFSGKDVLYRKRHRIVTGEQTIRIVTAKRPAFAGVDPYAMFIDRNSSDNIVATE
ncbi:MAG: M1 family aminopeptidase [Blastomonas sp.]